MIGIYDLINRNKYYCPEKPAIICNDERWNYRELNNRVDCIAAGLKRLGVKKGRRIGIFMKNSAYYVALIYALQKLGAVSVLINIRIAGQEFIDCMKMVKVDFLAYDQELLEDSDYNEARAWLIENNVIMLERTTAMPTNPGLVQMSLDNDGYGEIEDWREGIAEDDDALMLFTGGTTGKLSAAVHSHKGLLLIGLCRLLITDMARSEDILANYAPLFHMGGIIPMIHTLGCGACLIILDKYDPVSILQTIEREKVTVLRIIPPDLCSELYEYSKKGNYVTDSVRAIHFAGGLFSVGLGQKVFDAFPKAVIYNSYGQSEHIMSVQNVITREEFIQNPEKITYTGMPFGFSIPRLLDVQGRLVNPGEIGELHGYGPDVMSGLLTASGRETTGSKGNTGDLFYQNPDGVFICVGRSKDMIKSGGENVYAQEVEGVLLQMPEINRCAVLGLRDEHWGEIVAAAILLVPGAKLTEEDVVKFCKSKIASYKKPRRVFFLNELPLSGANKINKNALKKMLQALLKES